MRKIYYTYVLRQSRLSVIWFVLLTGCNRGAHPDLINHPAPQFTVQDDQQTLALSNFRGKVVVLNFWATWCPPCLEEMPSLVAMQERLKDHVVVIAVSLDEDEETYRQFLTEHQVKLLTIRDAKQNSNRLYGTFRFPETYIVDRSGILRRKFVGPTDWTGPEVMDYLSKL